MPSESPAQLAALADVTKRLDAAAVPYWLFGGWAVDFHAGAVTREHDDLDLAVALADASRAAELLGASGWSHAPEPDEDGGTGYERDGVRLELTYLDRCDDDVVTPLRDGEARWPLGAFGIEVRELHGVRVRVISLPALREGKATPRDEAAEAAKDRADFDLLSRLD